MNKLFAALASTIILASCGGSSPIPPADGQLAADNVSWVLATTFVDGSALTVGSSPRQIKETLIQWGPFGGPYNVGSVRVAAPAIVAVVPRGPADFSRCFIAFTVLNDNTMSSGTAQTCKVIPAPANNPTNLSVS